MKYGVPLLLLFLFLQSHSQTVSGVKEELKTLAQKVTASSCEGGGLLITNRAMNFLLANKIGTFLSESTDLSFYKNNVTFDAASGVFSVNHNLFQPSGADTPIRKFLVIGGRVNAVNAFASAFGGEPFRAEMGFTLKQTWLSKPKTFYTCAQKQLMDAERAVLLQNWLLTIDKRNADFEQSLSAISSADVPGQNLLSVKDSLRRNFVRDSREECNRQWAYAQTQLLMKRSAYKKITLHWTSIGLYLPVIREQFFVAKTTGAVTERKYNYPVELSLQHTRLYEWGLKGRLFLTLASAVFRNSNAQSGLLSESAGVYTGTYRHFFTPLLKGGAVWFPPDSHIGISVRAEQAFGEYNALNVVVGMPIVLINPETFPSATFHFTVTYADVSKTVFPSKNFKDKILVGMTIGVPFSRIIY